MSHSVELTTPIPSAEKVAERLGLSPQRRQLLFDLVDGRSSRQSAQWTTRKAALSLLKPKKASRPGVPTSR